MEITYFKEPFEHWVMDDFFDEDVARQLAEEFPDYDSDKWFKYDNPLENKKAINNWYNFPPVTYQAFEYLLSSMFVESIQGLTDSEVTVYPDYGLHGGGWHIQGNGGLLNVHLDYNIHPKTGQKRKYNLIIYLSDWDPSWGGNLELWDHDPETNGPKNLIKTLDCKFNRAVLFDASMNSWHGFSNSIQCPSDKYRKSLASYYLIDAEEGDDERQRALYAPRPDQKGSKEIEELIEVRSKL